MHSQGDQIQECFLRLLAPVAMRVPLLWSKSQHAVHERLAIGDLKSAVHESLHFWDDIISLLERTYKVGSRN
jgi:hypothetical protein